MKKYPEGIVLASIAAFVFIAVPALCAAQAQPAAPTLEEMKIKSPFMFTAVGDIVEHQPMAPLAEPGFQNLLKFLREADVSLANMEAPVVDSATPAGGGIRLTGLPDTIPSDIKAMGIGMMNLANNHALGNGEAALFSTMSLLNKAGIVYAGAGKDLQEARAPRFLTTPKGVVGLVGIFSIDANLQAPRSQFYGATYSVGGVPGDPGTDGLHLRTYYVVSAEQMQTLRAIHDSVYAQDAAATKESQDHLELFGTWYKVGAKPGDLNYTMDPRDLQSILQSIRSGKKYADFMIVTIHCHQYSRAFQTYTADLRIRDAGLDNGVPDFLVDLAHQSIDNGADAFVAQGVHTLRGVEIYKGKPIFYGLSAFTFQEPQSPTPSITGKVTEQQPAYGPKNGLGIFSWGALPNNLEGLLVTCQYGGGQLSEVRLYPLDLGQDESRPVSERGVPMTPSPEMAQRVLDKLQVLSKPFGTTISIENGVGVIRIPPKSN